MTPHTSAGTRDADSHQLRRRLRWLAAVAAVGFVWGRWVGLSWAQAIAAVLTLSGPLVLVLTMSDPPTERHARGVGPHVPNHGPFRRADPPT